MTCANWFRNGSLFAGCATGLGGVSKDNATPKQNRELDVPSAVGESAEIGRAVKKMKKGQTTSIDEMHVEVMAKYT